MSSEHDACSICSSPALNTLVSSFIFHTYFTSSNFFWSLSHFFTPCRADGRQPKSETSTPRPAVHAGFELRSPLDSLVPHSSVGAPPQPQTTPPLHAGEMPHATSQPKKVNPVKQTKSCLSPDHPQGVFYSSVEIPCTYDCSDVSDTTRKLWRKCCLCAPTNCSWVMLTFLVAELKVWEGTERLKWACCSLKVTFMNNIYLKLDWQ